MYEINSGEVVLYIDGNPIVCSGATLTLPVPESPSCTTKFAISGINEWTIQVSGIKDEEFTTEQLWNYNYYMAKYLPRKQKKAYRKKLVKMLYSNVNQAKSLKQVNNNQNSDNY